MYTSVFSNEFIAFTKVLVAALILWTIPWKIYAVWLAAKRNEKKWFAALLILNTASILELIYIFKIEKMKWTEVKQDFKKAWESIRSRRKS